MGQHSRLKRLLGLWSSASLALFAIGAPLMLSIENTLHMLVSTGLFCLAFGLIPVEVHASSGDVDRDLDLPRRFRRLVRGIAIATLMLLVPLAGMTLLKFLIGGVSLEETVAMGLRATAGSIQFGTLVGFMCAFSLGPRPATEREQ